MYVLPSETKSFPAIAMAYVGNADKVSDICVGATVKLNYES